MIGRVLGCGALLRFFLLLTEAFGFVAVLLMTGCCWRFAGSCHNVNRDDSVRVGCLDVIAGLLGCCWAGVLLGCCCWPGMLLGSAAGFGVGGAAGVLGLMMSDDDGHEPINVPLFWCPRCAPRPVIGHGMVLTHDNQDCKFLEPSANFTIGARKCTLLPKLCVKSVYYLGRG